MRPPGGYRRQSPLIAMLSEHGRGQYLPPSKIVAQIGVSPINRTMPAAVLNSTAPRYMQGPRNPQLEANAAAPLDMGHLGRLAAGTPPMPTPGQGSYDVGGQQVTPNAAPQQQMGLAAMIPHIRNLIVQALADQRPASMGGRLI